MTSRVALVTGGTGGIGTAIVKRLADMGHKVVTNYRNEEKARAWQDKMKAEGYDFTLVKGDVGTPEEAALAFLGGAVARDPNNKCNACGFQSSCSLSGKGGCGRD